jgi:hypothetical protein
LEVASAYALASARKYVTATIRILTPSMVALAACVCQR